ncbi:MAG: transposase, partial [Planctomycetia bacterium]|nr:transposase [Planctomycetia bacterium]
KEVHGAGQQQLRHVWANVAAFNLILWMHTLIELWAWRKPQSELCDRSRSPWDKAARRPSHADRRNALRRESLGAGFFSARGVRTLPRKIREMVESLLHLAT